MLQAIRSDRVITPDGIRSATILIKDGRIEDVLNDSPGGDLPVTDLGNKIVMAGVVDPHVHINEPGRTEWEGFDTATKASIAGGVTSLVEMPLNASPVTTNKRAFEAKGEAANGKLHSNCG